MRAVYEDAEGGQYVHDDSGEIVRGVCWIPREADEPLIVESREMPLAWLVANVITSDEKLMRPWSAIDRLFWAKHEHSITAVVDLSGRSH
jgi:hypothetical protein